MIIAKKPENKDCCAFHWRYFPSAREGLKSILKIPALAGKRILIPAYIGHSTREGSGVFDPIVETKTPYHFYRMDRFLNIDVNDLKQQMSLHKGNVLLLIHYFGFKDVNLALLKQLARAHDMTIIEDFAHAFYTFYNDPQVDFDYGIFSIHKMFPETQGGMVLSGLHWEGTAEHRQYDLFRYNIPLIIQKRIRNYGHILQALSKHADGGGIEILRPELGILVPQTFPILLKDRNIRDQLYFAMNEEGYGLVSLYHELISPVGTSFSVEHDISDRILNFPVHQEADEDRVEGMLQAFLRRMS